MCVCARVFVCAFLVFVSGQVCSGFVHCMGMSVDGCVLGVLTSAFVCAVLVL